MRFPSRAGASGSHYLPWALSRVQHDRVKSKRLGGASAGQAGHDCGGVYSRGVSSVFVRGKGASAIAARTAGQQRASGRGGRRSRDTGRRELGNRNATAKVGATGSASRDERPQSQL